MRSVLAVAGWGDAREALADPRVDVRGSRGRDAAVSRARVAAIRDRVARGAQPPDEEVGELRDDQRVRGTLAHEDRRRGPDATGRVLLEQGGPRRGDDPVGVDDLACGPGERREDV